MSLLLLLLLAFATPDRPAPGSASPGDPGEAAPQCDGNAPELLNADAVPWSYTLTCGEKSEQKTVAPGEKQVLKGYSGCTLTLGTLSEKLHTEMVCTLKAGPALTCELL